MAMGAWLVWIGLTGLLRAASGEAPQILLVTPVPGEATNLTRITVVFSKPVTGVDVGDLVLAGYPATDFRQVSATTYEFGFGEVLPFGPVTAGWIPNHGIADTENPPNAFWEVGPDAAWGYVRVDPTAPILLGRLPAAGVVRQLSGVELTFSEPVTGVDAGDLLINGVPAVEVTGIAAGPYVFTFPSVSAGRVELRFATGHGIRDLGVRPLEFAGGSWEVTVDPAMTDPRVRIHEILAANATGLRDEDGEEQGWIEIHNAGTGVVNLGGLTLTDDVERPGKWEFPPTLLGPGEYRVIFASGKDRRDGGVGSPLHTGFRLARRGEYLGLFNAEWPRRAIDGLADRFPVQRNDVSWGRRADGSWAYHATPTPGAMNRGVTVIEACEPVRFSVARGYFNAPFELVLTCATPGVTIRYTLGGAEPSSTNSQVYGGPIRVDRTMVVRADAVREGWLGSETGTHTYLMQLSTAQRGLPAFSLVTASNNLTGPTGIVGMQGGTRDASGAWVRRTATDYFNPLNRGPAWERPVSVEFLSPRNNGEFQIDAGLRLHASDYFRPRLTPGSKFSWRLYFRGDYGEGRLRFPLLPVSNVEEFDALVLRAGSNDSNPFVRDEIQRRLFADCGQVSARGLLTVLYLNGRYSGYYNPVERIEADFLSIHHGGGDAWDVLSQSGPLDGDRVNFDQMMSVVRTGSPTNSVWYQGMASRLDLTNFVDYLLVNAYGYNGDWPHNNWRAGRERRPGALWRFYIWDAEWSFGTYGRSVTGNTFTELGTTEIGTLYSRLRQNPEFRLLFADRAHRHLYHQGALTAENVTRRFAETTVGLSSLIGGLDRSITNTWVRSRPGPLRGHLHGQGLFGSSNAPVFSIHGGRVGEGTAIGITNLAGAIWYTLNGPDPRVAFSGLVAANARQYSAEQPPVISQPTVLRARSLNNGVWSALTEAVFSIDALSIPVRIGELMVNPPGGSAYEFVEIRNISSRPVNLAGFTFEGIGFRFPPNSTLPGRGVWVLASDNNPAAFVGRYPTLTVVGWYSGALDNAGEAIVLRDAAGGMVDRVVYGVDAGWPDVAGNGRSLERTRFDLDPGDPAAWEASTMVGGSPGVILPPAATVSPVRIDEVFAMNRGRILRGTKTPDFVELLGMGPGVTDLAGWTLRRADRTNRFVFPGGYRIGPGERRVIWCGEAGPGDLTADFRLAADGGTLVLGDATGRRMSVWVYGQQASEWSVGMVEGWATPVLTEPSPGEGNELVPTAPSSALALNEWLANPVSGGEDFIELFNRSEELPLWVPGHALQFSNTVHVLGFPVVIPPRGFVALTANGGGGPNELPFKLPAAGNTLRLIDRAGETLESVSYTNALEGVSSGRFPDGTDGWVSLPLGGTPGRPNLLTPPPGPHLTEMLAHADPQSATPELMRDWIELGNSSGTNVALGGWRLVRVQPRPASWSFPVGITLVSGGNLRVFADATVAASTGNAAVLNTGFDLPDGGGVIELQGPDGVARDRLRFGAQLPGRSIGWDGTGWHLMATATPGMMNSGRAFLSFGESVRINEWLALDPVRSDFIELHNGAANPVNLGGWRLTDDPSLAGINRFTIEPLTFIGAGGWLVFDAESGRPAAPTRAPFQLSALGEVLRLYTPVSNLVDSVTVLPAMAGISDGRFPDGAPGASLRLTQPTPGLANRYTDDRDGDGLPDAWELANGLDPDDPSDADLDDDGDGMSNRAEYLAGTDPQSASSVLALEAAWETGVLRLTFTAQSDRSYTLQGRPGLDAPWGSIQNISGQTGIRRIDWMDAGAGVLPMRYFRVLTPALP
jgi:hypothetical protein